MKKILIVGDSLTAGQLGASFVTILVGRRSSYRIISQGRGGDTLAGISRRLPALLERHAPDMAVIEAGANDLLLPWFRSRGGIWRGLGNQLERSGCIPSPGISAFHGLYVETIAAARQHVPAIIVTTITCLGEDLNSELNRQRSRYNDVIRLLARECSVRVADAGQAFDEVLQTVPCPGAYLLDRYSHIYLDTLMTVLETGADFLSRRRGLALTMDGVHLNRRGARLLAETIHDQLTAETSKA